MKMTQVWPRLMAAMAAASLVLAASVPAATATTTYTIGGTVTDATGHGVPGFL